MLRGDLLSRLGIEIFEIRLGHGFGSTFLHDAIHNRHRRFSQDADRGCNEFELTFAELFDRKNGFVLPGDQHVANATLHKGRRRAASAGIEHRHVLKERLEKIPRLSRIARALQLVAIGGEIVPARATGCLRVRGDNRNARLDEIVPVLDALGISLSHEEHDGGRVGCAVVRQPLLPVLRDQPPLLRQHIDIIREPERDDIRR